MRKSAWKKFLNRVGGAVASVKRVFACPQQVAVHPKQPPPLAEDKQHYIPRLLFKGFASTYISRKQVSVWYFQRDCSEGQKENTRKIGYEPDF